MPKLSSSPRKYLFFTSLFSSSLWLKSRSTLQMPSFLPFFFYYMQSRLQSFRNSSLPGKLSWVPSSLINFILRSISSKCSILSFRFWLLCAIATYISACLKFSFFSSYLPSKRKSLDLAWSSHSTRFFKSNIYIRSLSACLIRISWAIGKNSYSNAFLRYSWDFGIRITAPFTGEGCRACLLELLWLSRLFDLLLLFSNVAPRNLRSGDYI